MEKRGTSPAQAERTRDALIAAALKLFGSKGYAGTSTREIAAEAKANIGSIAYHFGSKEGLRQACAAFVAETIGGVAQAAMRPPSRDAAEAAARLEAVLERMVTFIVAAPEAGEIVRFLLRELADPTPALDTIYAGVFEPVHRQLCQIWAQASGDDPESPRTRLLVFSLIGQVVYFRIARPAVLRRMKWERIGPAEAARILDVARDNLRAILDARKGGQ